MTRREEYESRTEAFLLPVLAEHNFELWDVEYVKEAGEYTPGSFLSSAFSNRLFGLTNEDILWEHQYKVITELAQKGPCVIVGRCADYILQDKADCLKVFIHADLAFRAKRIVEVYGQREQSPEERLRDKDKRRAAYHRFYTNMKWGHAQNYHLTLDSGVIGVFSQGESVEVLGSTRADGMTWYKVSRSDGSTGYVAADYCSLGSGDSSSSPTGTITGTDVRMRASYSTDSDVLGYFDNGETVTILDDVTSGGQRWLKVQRSDGSVGWVSADFCAEN